MNDAVQIERSRELIAAIIMRAVEDVRAVSPETLKMERQYQAWPHPRSKQRPPEVLNKAHKAFEDGEKAAGWLFNDPSTLKKHADRPRLTFTDCCTYLGVDPQTIRDEVRSQVEANQVRLGN